LELNKFRYLCDWGGVGKELWKNAVMKYYWEIDVDSVEIMGLYSEEDQYNQGYRYSVYMK
jgi:hypothetical protein